MSDPVIQVDSLWKKYRLGLLGTGTLRHDFNRWLHRICGKPDPYAKVGETEKAECRKRRAALTSGIRLPTSDAQAPAQTSGSRRSISCRDQLTLRDDEIWALRDISFELKQGEVLGIIGGNGAGKSTLLKILSRVTAPTSGEVRVKGRIASLLEVGTGFHPELTGRENIFLNGAILGMTKAEVRKKLDEIVAFAEVEKFLNTPVKRYSSGMYVRLAFAVAAHLDSEILIVDEVLAVGDAQFQKKCLGKMSEVSQVGRTILFVSHNMAAVRSLCTAALVLREGGLVQSGAVDNCTEAYLASSSNRGSSTWSRGAEPIKSNLWFTRASACLTGAQPHLGLEIQVDLASREQHAEGFVAVDIVDSMGAVIMQALPRLQPFISNQRENHSYRIHVDLPPLIPGCYWLTLWTGSHNTNTYDLVNGALSVEVLESPTKGRSFPHGHDHGAVVPVSSIQEIPVER